MISDVLRDALVADAPLSTLLATYEFTTGVVEAAIFTTERIPNDCSNPSVIIDELGGTPWGDRCVRGAETFCRVRVYGDKNWNLSALRDIAWMINRVLDRADLNTYTEATYGYHAMLCQADPPAYLPDPDGYPGYLIGVRIVVTEV